MMSEDRLNEGLNFVSRYASHVGDWQTVKKELLKFFNPEERKCFSTRDPLTKAQRFNEFEEGIVEKWFKLTGVTLIIKK